ncbi:probable oxidoreductase Env9p [Diutina catenulata]
MTDTTDTMPKSLYDPSTAEYLNPSTDRKVAVVTGGAGGLGWYTVLHLYLHGYIVYMAARNPEKVKKAIEDIKTEADKRVAAYAAEQKSSRWLGEIHHQQMDLLSLASVNEAAEALVKKEPVIDILINNAGLMGVPHEVTKDGYEIQYQVNFVAHFLFTLKLLPSLQKSKSARVVQLASIGHNFAFKYFTPANKLGNIPNFVWTWVRYGNAKTSEILFAQELARKYPTIRSMSVHPGIVAGTALYDHWKKLPVLGPIVSGSMKAVDSVGGVNNEQGALSSLRAALDPSVANLNGGYLSTGGVIGKPSKVASDPTNAQTTWDWNLKELEKRRFKFDL